MRATRSRRRNVLVTDIKALGFGNVLYLWMHAEKMRAHGLDYWVVIEGKDLWLDAFPSLRDLSLTWEDLADDDYLEANETPRLYQRFGVDFTPLDLDHFVTKHLAPHVAPADAGMVVNVRRGDYYTTYADRYAMDIPAYLARALPLARAVPGERILVVSDDPAWCRDHLGDMLGHLGPVEYAPPGDPVGHFLSVCASPRLVGTNSTFSYWGGHVADRLGRPVSVVMPGFHSRHLNRGMADQLDPRWSVT